MDKTTLTHSQSQLKSVFITSNLLTAKDQFCGKVLVWLPMKRMTDLILLFVRLVFRRCEQGKFFNFLQLPTASEILKNLCSSMSWLQELCIATFSFFACRFIK